MNGVARILAERRRQVIEEGFTEAHDAEHRNGELVAAAVCYATWPEYEAVHQGDERAPWVPDRWPWGISSWKPSGVGHPAVPDLEDRIRNLVKAGALIAAEIDRLLVEGPDD